MKIIVGLGNPGLQYKQTRHNVGFLLLDALAERHAASILREKCDSFISQFQFHGEDVFLIKPQTYMNLSGKAVKKIWFSLQPQCSLQDFLFVFDDVALDFGRLRFRARGSSGGHNGCQSLIDQLGTDAFNRLRIGIGPCPLQINLADFVLQSFSGEEKRVLPDILERAVEACLVWVQGGIKSATTFCSKQ